jgi:DNA-binding MltR family transcriptional regulator
LARLYLRVFGPDVYRNAATCDFRFMIELVRTNDAVVISFVESLMRDAGIACFVADQNMSVLDGSLGILPRRVMVDAEKIDAARRILKDAGIENEIRKK